MAQDNTTLAATLQQLCTERSSGALLIRGGIGQTARLHVTDGEIVALFVQDKKGSEAVPLLAAFEARQINFIPGMPSSVKTPLPSTQEILALLTAAQPVPRRTAAPATSAPDATPGKPIDEATRTLLEETLVHYIGPMAAILCENVLREHHDVDEAIKALAAHIPDTQRARRFATEIRSHLTEQAV